MNEKMELNLISEEQQGRRQHWFTTVWFHGFVLDSQCDRGLVNLKLTPNKSTILYNGDFSDFCENSLQEHDQSIQKGPERVKSTKRNGSQIL